MAFTVNYLYKGGKEKKVSAGLVWMTLTPPWHDSLKNDGYYTAWYTLVIVPAASKMANYDY